MNDAHVVRLIVHVTYSGERLGLGRRRRWPLTTKRKAVGFWGATCPCVGTSRRIH